MQRNETEFGLLLKSLREKRGISQSKLAEVAEFDHSYVSRLESGARSPTREAVDRLGEALELEQPQRDSLLAAAGFLPRDITSLLASEPVIGELLVFLQNEAVPSEYRDNLRQMLGLLAQQVSWTCGGTNAQASALPIGSSSGLLPGSDLALTTTTVVRTA